MLNITPVIEKAGEAIYRTCNGSFEITAFPEEIHGEEEYYYHRPKNGEPHHTAPGMTVNP